MKNCFTSYQLIIEISEELNIKIGRLGTFTFPAGQYIYTGSAKKNIEQRIARHLKKEKKVRWHIDYLTVHPSVQIIEVRRSDKNECSLNKKTKGTIAVPGFGASDCRKACGSHLKFIAAKVDIKQQPNQECHFECSETE
jgi:Uri superfamily endonuclease